LRSDMPNGDAKSVTKQLIAVFEAMHVEVPSVETDLFDSGILDSQRLVELLFQIEQSFDTQIDVQDFEIENFRCIETIAKLIVQRKSDNKTPQLSRAGGSAA
jgi:acyl carrier protein